MNAENLKKHINDALEEMKGQDIRVLEIKEVSNFADYMIIASGTSNTHVKALARTVSDNIRAQGVKPIGITGEELGEWVLVDFGDVVVHLMRPEVRAYYELEKFWDKDVRALVEQHHNEK